MELVDCCQSEMGVLGNDDHGREYRESARCRVHGLATDGKLP
jgi:hypothetical protein